MAKDLPSAEDQAGLKIRLGLFVSLVPPMLWYEWFNNQKAGREACRSLNSHLGKVCKLVGATVVPHPHIKVEEKWFHDPRTDPTTLSEPAYDLFIQDLCLAITEKTTIQSPQSPMSSSCTILASATSVHSRYGSTVSQPSEAKEEKA